MDLSPRLFLVTGVMAAGKSTVAQALSERFERSAHVRGDTFRRFITSGRVDMTLDPAPEALDQLRLRYQLAAATADRYVDAGFVTVLQDVVLGSLLREVVARIETRPLAVVVLAPDAATVAERDVQRTKTGYTGFSAADMDLEFRERTPHLGLWVDNSRLTVPETVDHIIGHAADAVI
ncbi:MAG: AAA family ATPase [Actinomycetota bacterium]